MILPLLLLVTAAPLARAVALINTPHDHSHAESKALPAAWFQPETHRVHSLFKRAPGDGINYAPVGSPTWSAPYPRGSPDPSSLPQAWVDALNDAVEAGKIPNIPQTTNTPNTNPRYPPGVNPGSIEVCSTTYKCRDSDVIWDAPDGYFASSFDDGPYPQTSRLVDFLTAHNVKTTHFMIGVNILAYPDQFLEAFNAGNDIAVHTWTHPYMTTLSNLQVVGQLGWTMEVIHNSTGGRVPRYWRPPYGDADNRVVAIAREVFGLETVIWNYDTDDWSMATGGTTPAQIHAKMAGWLSGPKSPGLVVLEHEIADGDLEAFESAFPLIAQNGWNFASLATLFGDVYQNANSSSDGPVTVADILGNGPEPSTTTSENPSDSGTSTSITTSAANLAATSSPGNNQSSGAVSISISRAQLWGFFTVVLSVLSGAMVL